MIANYSYSEMHVFLKKILQVLIFINISLNLFTL